MVSVNKVAEELDVHAGVLKAIVIEQEGAIPFEMVGCTMALREDAAELLKARYQELHLPLALRQTRKVKKNKAGAA